MKILLAVDGSTYSNAAIDEVATRPWPSGSVIRIISVAEPFHLLTTESWVLSEGFFEESVKAGKDRARNTVNKAKIQLRASVAPEIRLETQILDGQPKYVISDEAETWGADLIVVGSHGYRGLRRLWLGSVSQAVVTHAKCSVRIVRGRQGSVAEERPREEPAVRR